MKLIDKTALIEKLKDKVCIFPTVVRRAIDNAPVIEITVDKLFEAMPDVINTKVSRIYLTNDERKWLAKCIYEYLQTKGE